MDKGNDPVVYGYVQEGGATGEFYFHSFDTMEDALAGRRSCAKAAYRTSNVLEAPSSLANHPKFSEFIEGLLGSLDSLDYVEDEDEEGVQDA